MAEPMAQAMSKRNQNRLDTLCRVLVEAYYHYLSEDVRQRYRGNIAIDATKIQIRERQNSTGTDEATYEPETAVMVWNKPGENIFFPSLITEINCHNPGEFVGHAANLTEHHQNLGFNRFTTIVDRAYDHERIETFRLPSWPALGSSSFSTTKPKTSVSKATSAISSW